MSKITASANGEDCQVRIVGVCTYDSAKTIWSHARHGSAGKGKSIKACDSTCYPACADRPGVVGCHTLLGAAGMDRDERRALEARYAAETRATLGRA